MIRFCKTKIISDLFLKRSISDLYLIRCIKEVKPSARAYFGLATLGGTLLAFGGRDSDDQALASVGIPVRGCS